MNKKIVGIFVMTLLIATAIFTVESIKPDSINETNQFNNSDDLEFVPGEFIVKFTEGTKISDSTIDSLNEKNQVSSIEKVFMNAENTILDNIYILKVPQDSNIISIVNEYSSLPNVEYAEPNTIGVFCLTPNDEYFQYQWSLHNTGQNIMPPEYPPVYGAPDADIDAFEAWDIETGDQDVIIALIDSGIDYTHPDLADRIWVNEDEIPDNEVDDDGNGFIDDIMGWDFPYDDSDPLDLNGHGTFCGGVFSAVTNNNIGIASICRDCKIMILKIAYDDGVNLVSDWVKAIRYAADNDADIMSMEILTYMDQGILRDTIDYAYDKGVFMCASAGNDDTSDEGYPAAYGKVLAVAATNQHDERCDEDDLSWQPGDGSNYGDWVDIAAPGNWIATTSPTYPFYYYPDSPMNYTAIGGTSISCPIVAGVAALLLSRDSTLSPEEVKTLICENVDPYDSEYYIGTGRINAYKALKALINHSNNPPEKPEPPSGEINCKLGIDYIYYASTTDPEGDDIFYLFDWGNNMTSFIMGPYESGTEGNASNVWFEKEEYEVKVQAIDEFGAESEWSDPLLVIMPKTKLINTPFLTFLENHPHLFPLLRHSLELFFSSLH